jgi:hypothetical protein
MAWSRLFRRKANDSAAIVYSPPKPWAEIALPPTDSTSTQEQSESITTAPRPAVVKARPSVHLGFADGTSHALPDSSGESEELVRLAARLIDGPRA